MIGQWIDGLTDEQRDRIIEHPDPTFLGSQWWSPDLRCGCLVGCVMGEDQHSSDGTPIYSLRLHGPLQPFDHWTQFNELGEVGGRFPRLASRFGPERIWRACKQRAAKANKVNLSRMEVMSGG